MARSRAGSRVHAPGHHDDDPEAGPEALARAICLRLLAAAPRTRAQLAEALRKRGVPEDASSAVLDRYTEVGLIDDASFARAWVQSRHSGRGLARRALAEELRRRGVDQGVTLHAVALVGDEDEEAAARALVARRLATTTGLAPDTRARRLIGMLARRGYSGALARQVVLDALRVGEGEAGQGALPRALLEECDGDPLDQQRNTD